MLEDDESGGASAKCSSVLPRFAAKNFFQNQHALLDTFVEGIQEWQDNGSIDTSKAFGWVHDIATTTFAVAGKSAMILNTVRKELSFEIDFCIGVDIFADSNVKAVAAESVLLLGFRFFQAHEPKFGCRLHWIKNKLSGSHFLLWFSLFLFFNRSGIK
jgi:hypothetical protein